MNVYEIVEKRYDSFVVVFGFFDGFYIGYKKLFEVLNVNVSGIKKVVFIFKNYFDNFFGFDIKYIFINEERLEFFRNYGIDDVYFIEFNKKIM